MAYAPRGAGGDDDDGLAAVTATDSRESSDSDRNLATDPCTPNVGDDDGSGGGGCGGGGGGSAAPEGGPSAAGADHQAPSSVAAVDKAGSRASGGTSAGGGVGGGGGGGGAAGGSGCGGRWKPTESQRRLLSATFAQNPYPDVTTKNLLAEQLGVNRPRVSKWFQHRRESATRAGCFQGVEQRARRTPTELLVLNGTHKRSGRSEKWDRCGGRTESARRCILFFEVVRPPLDMPLWVRPN